jgi:hypothetical protein
VGATTAVRRPWRGRPGQVEEEYRLTASHGTTELTQRIRAWPRRPFRVFQPLIARQLQSLIPADLARLQQLAEQPQ